MNSIRSSVSRYHGISLLTAWALALLVGGCALDDEANPGADIAGDDIAAEDLGTTEQWLAETTCGHSICETGAAVSSTCDSCVESICDVDPFCCTTAWDSICVGEVTTICHRGPVAVTSSTVVSKIKLRIQTGGDDLRSGSQASGAFQTAVGTTLPQSLNGGAGFPSNSVRTAVMTISPARTLGSFQQFQLTWDGAPRNWFDTYDNWNADEIRFIHEPAGFCPTALGVPIHPGRMTGSRTSFTIPVSFP